MMKLLDLFSGIGGFSLGMEATKKIKTIAFCEKDEFCRKVLKKHWSNIKQYNDIRSINGKEIAADIVSGGFPCQPFSVAGKRKGTEDDRYLWDEMLRVITEVKPRWVVGENVQGIINIDNGLVLRRVQTDLEAQGFQVQCFIIPASSVGAWHQRKRVWIIAHSNNNGHSTQGFKKTSNEKTQFGFSGTCENVPNSKSFGSNERRFRNNTQEKQIQQQIRGEDSIYVSNSNSRLRNRRRTIKQSGENEVRRIYSSEKEETKNDLRSKTFRCNAVSGKTETISNTNSKGLQGHELQSDNLQEKDKTTINSNCSFERQQTWWEAQSKLCGVPDGISYELDKDRANRIKALGNAIVPQIAYEIGQAILKAEYE